MRVAYFNYLYDAMESSVGAAAHIREISRAIDDLGVDVRIHNLNRFTSPEASVQKPVRGWLKNKFSKYLNQVNAILANGRYFIREWKIVQNERPDVVWMRYNMLNFSLAVICRLLRVPLILEINAPMAYESRRFSENWQIPFFPLALERLNIRLASRVIVVSNALREYYIRYGVTPDKIRVVPNGADSSRFHPDIDGSRVREEYKLKKKTVIGFIGSFHYWHGIDHLAGFIRETLEKYPKTVFFLVGEGPLKEKLAEMLQTEVFAGQAVFSGYVSHEKIPEILGAMDILLAPYPKLDFFYYSPLKIYEYLAAGKAVVASRLGQIKEMIQDGKNGMLFEADLAGEMKAKCFCLIEDKKLRQALGKAGRRWIEKGATWRHRATEITDILQEAASGAETNA
jgi:glycosyltransferase involved in cell wall biosynthesis